MQRTIQTDWDELRERVSEFNGLYPQSHVICIAYIDTSYMFEGSDVMKNSFASSLKVREEYTRLVTLQRQGKAAVISLLAVGDVDCDKTTLLDVFSHNRFPHESSFNVFDYYEQSIKVDDKQVLLSMCDMDYREDAVDYRKIMYPMADVILMCFAINRRKTFENVPIKWIPEVKRFCPHTPIILVGNNVDKRTDQFVQKDEGEAMAETIQAYDYLECSAQIGVREVFEAAARAALDNPVFTHTGSVNNVQ